MKRSSSWKNLQKTFASTPIIVPKRARNTRTKVIKTNFIRSLDESIDFQIEDSDEEPNVSSATPSSTPIQTPLQRHQYRRLAKPLLINTSLNSSIASNSIAFESDDSLPGEPELRDVSELQPARRQSKARSKSLLFLSTSTKNHRNSENRPPNSTPSKSESPTKQRKCNMKTTHNDKSKYRNRAENAAIESDSSNESGSPKKRTLTSNNRKTLSSEIVFTQTSESTNPVIESQSSQFSWKFDSPIVRLPNKRPKTRKHVKGGLVERLNKVLSSTKSEYSFWMNERTSNLIEPGTKMRIDKMESSYGRVLLYCSNVGGQTESNIVNVLCIDPSFKRLPVLQIGKIIEIGLDCCGYAIGNNSSFYPQVSKILV